MASKEAMRGQLRGYEQAHRNANNALSMLQMTEGHYQVISDTIGRLTELAVEAANDSLSDGERGLLDNEFQNILSEIERITDVAEWNGIETIDPQNTFLTFQVGTRNSGNDQFSYEIEDQRPGELGIGSSSIGTRADAQVAVGDLEGAQDSLNTDRSALGAAIGRLQRIIGNLDSSIEDYGRSIGVIGDADVGYQSAEFTRQQVLNQAGVAMLSQANAQPNVALKLLG